ncbi:MAG: DUF2845 domain-containing protein [Pseudomonadota bacterium]
MQPRLILLPWLTCFGLLAPAAALDLGVQQSSIRCGRELVTVGQRSFHLLDKCGDPDHRQVVAVSRLSDGTAVRQGRRVLRARDDVSLVTEEWVYRPGRGRLTRVLTVTGGVVTDIRLFDRQ